MLPHENPALDRRLRQFLKSYFELAQQTAQQAAEGSTGAPAPAPPDFSTMPYEVFQTLAPFIEAQLGQAMAGVSGPSPAGAPEPERIEIDGLDGNRVPVDIYRPATGGQSGAEPAPCIVYLHGGGMAFQSTKHYRPILQQLAVLGAVVVAPDFRNSPVARFPAGVNDCLAAVTWARANLPSLGAGRLMLAGESGGGTLALTVPLVAHARGLDPSTLVDTIWVDGPECLNPVAAAAAPPRSYSENAIYATHDLEQALRRFYTDRPEDPCAFPLNASDDALARFPRTSIVVYELDSLRDEGIAFYRRMLAAGHESVECMQIHGMTHCSMLARAILPGFTTRQLARMIAFAR